MPQFADSQSELDSYDLFLIARSVHSRLSSSDSATTPYEYLKTKRFDVAKEISHGHALSGRQTKLLHRLVIERLGITCSDAAELLPLSLALGRRYRRLTGRRPPDPPTSEKDRRHYCLNLMDEIQYHRVIAGFADSSFGEVLRPAVKWLAGALVVATILTLIDVTWIPQSPPTRDVRYLPCSLLAACATAGAIGSYISVLRRLKSHMKSRMDPFEFAEAVRRGRPTMYNSLIAGALFGVGAYFLIASGFFHIAPLYPALGKPKIDSARAKSNWFEGQAGYRPTESKSDETGLLLAYPQSGGDYARLIILCFVAGFLERLIPDVLDKMAKKKLRPDSDEMTNRKPRPDSDKPGEGREPILTRDPAATPQVQSPPTVIQVDLTKNQVK